jgi:hypothetical protein
MTVNERTRPRRPSFLSASLWILACMLIGQLSCLLAEPYVRAAQDGYVRGGWPGLLAAPGRYLDEPGLGARDFVFAGFAACGLVFLALQFAAIKRFLRSMHTGVALISWLVVSVVAGVLVPQMDGFEDPDQRITPQNYEEQYKQFAFAEGYFLYHVLHLYGIGMPQAQLTAEQRAGLERFGARYGAEERDNRAKQMQAAISGQARSHEIQGFVERHDVALRRFFNVASALQLNRAYKSYWFFTLCALLFAALFANTSQFPWRKLFTVQKAGFTVVHSGMLLLLAGGGLSKACTDRGVLHLDLTEPPSDTYWRHYDPEKRARMPFALRLDHFARREWVALEVHFLEEEFSSRVPRYTLWNGRTLDQDWVDDGQGGRRPRLRLIARKLHDRASIGAPQLEEGSEAEGDELLPIADLRVIAPAADEDGTQAAPAAPEYAHLYLSPMMRSQAYHDPAGRFRIAAGWGSKGSSLFPREEDRLGTLYLELDGSLREFPVELEAKHRVGEYEVEIQRATANFAIDGPKGPELIDTRPLAEQPFGQAAIWIAIRRDGEQGVEERLVLDGLDAREHGLDAKHRYKDLAASLQWDRWAAPGPPRYVLHWGEGAAPELLAQDGRSLPIELGKPLPIPGGEQIVPQRFFERARVLGREIEFLPPTERDDGWDADFYARDPRGLELEIVRDPGTAQERSERILLATSRESGADEWVSEDRRFGLRVLENTEGFPFEWRSVLSVIERDGEGRPFVVPLGPERAREVRVNDYFHYRGYRFFQTNAIPELPTYSGIGVVYDPGIPFVLVGMYTVIAGALFAFIVRPIVLARRKQEQTA